MSEMEANIGGGPRVVFPVPDRVDVMEVRHVLWHLGDTVLGIRPGHFTQRIMDAASAADAENLRKLAAGWPSLMYLWDLGRRSTEGLEALRSWSKMGVVEP